MNKEKDVIKVTTINANPKTAFSLKTENNTNYMITINVSAKVIGAIGGGSYSQTRRITVENKNIIISAPLANSQNSTIIGSNILVTTSGNTVDVQVVGTNNTIHWVLDVGVITAN